MSPQVRPRRFPRRIQRAWREARWRRIPVVSIDEDENTVYVFFDESDSEVTMTLSYSISNFVQVYDDVAEVYWQYIGHGWAVDSDHVTTTLTVPVAAGTQVRAGDNVRAWGHGPLDGSLSIGDDGAIYAQVSSVNAGRLCRNPFGIPCGMDERFRLGGQQAYGQSTRLRARG